MNLFHQKQKGFTVIEILVYMAILTMVVSVLISATVVLARVYREVSVGRTIESSALLALDRISSTVRAASSIDLANTTLNSSSGVLTLNAVSPEGVAYVAKFYIVDGVVQMNINGIYEGQLTSSSTQVTSLMFRSIDTGVSDALKIDLTISATVNSDTKTENFYTTAILKNSY